MALTHYIPAFTNNGPHGTQGAACNQFVDPRTFSAEPTCPQCRLWIAEDARMLDELREDTPEALKGVTR